jgi:hypothetical protein
MSRFFVWLSGTDRNILDACEGLAASERTRFGNLGALVLVPALLGGFGMGYAVSTINGAPVVFLTAGCVWFGIMLAFDRYLVATIHRSKLKGARSGLLAVLVRLVFSVVVGVGVAHPITLLWFGGALRQQIAGEQRTSEAKIETQATVAKQALPVEPVEAELATKIETSRCLGSLQTAERSGHAVELPCGYSSPLESCGPRCVFIGEQKQKLDGEIAALRISAEAAAARRRAAAEGIDASAAAAIADTRRHLSTDYLSRVQALSRLEEQDAHVTQVKVFLLLLFVGVDLMAMTMKLSTPPGEYESIRDSRLLEAEVREEAQRELLRASAGSEAMINLKAKHAYMSEDVRLVGELANTFAVLYAEQTAAFERVISGIERRLPNLGNPGLSGMVSNQIADLRATQQAAWNQALKRAKAHFEAP